MHIFHIQWVLIVLYYIANRTMQKKKIVSLNGQTSHDRREIQHLCSLPHYSLISTRLGASIKKLGAENNI